MLTLSLEERNATRLISCFHSKVYTEAMLGIESTSSQSDESLQNYWRKIIRANGFSRFCDIINRQNALILQCSNWSIDKDLIALTTCFNMTRSLMAPPDENAVQRNKQAK